MSTIFDKLKEAVPTLKAKNPDGIVYASLWSDYIGNIDMLILSVLAREVPGGVDVAVIPVFTLDQYNEDRDVNRCHVLKIQSLFWDGAIATGKIDSPFLKSFLFSGTDPNPTEYKTAYIEEWRKIRRTKDYKAGFLRYIELVRETTNRHEAILLG